MREAPKKEYYVYFDITFAFLVFFMSPIKLYVSFKNQFLVVKLSDSQSQYWCLQIV